MQNYQLVLTEHLNHYGYLFGGTLLKWVDECAYIAARLDHPGESFVTAGMERVTYRKRVELGSILSFNVKKKKTGNTSITYEVTVKVASAPDNETSDIFSTDVTLVCMDTHGNKRSLT